MINPNVNIRILANSDQARAEFARLSTSMERIIGVTRTMGHSLAAFAGVSSFIEAGKSVAAVADRMALLDTRIRGAVRAIGEFVSAKAGLVSIATDAGAPLADTVELFERIAGKVRDLGGAQAQALAITRAAIDGIQASGASAEGAAGAVEQFGRAMASGVMSTQQFNAINREAPRLLEAVAEELGVNVEQLRRMAEAGTLTSSVLGNALMRRMAELRTEAASMPATVGSAMDNLRTQFGLLVGDFSRQTEATRGLAAAIDLLARNLRTLVELTVTVAKVAAGYYLLTTGVTVLTAAITRATIALTAWRAALAADAAATAAAGIVAVGAAATAATPALLALRTAVAGIFLAFAAYELGAWLFKHSLAVRLFVNDAVTAAQLGWEQLATAGEKAAARIQYAYDTLKSGVGWLFGDAGQVRTLEDRLAAIDAAHQARVKAIKAGAGDNEMALLLEESNLTKASAPETSKPPKPLDNSDPTAGAKARAERESAIALEQLKTSLARQADLRDQGLLGERQFIEQKRSLAEQEIAIEERKQHALLGLAAPGSAEAEKAREALGKLAEQRLQLELRTAGELRELERKAQGDITAVQVEALRERGELARAYQTEFFAQNRELIARLQAGGAADMAQLQALMQRYLAGYRQAQEAEAQGLLDRANGRLDAVRSRLDAEVTVGAKTQAQAQAELRKETAAVAREVSARLVPALRQLIETAPNDEERERWRKLLAEIEAIAAAGQQKGWLDGLRQGLRDYAAEVGDVFTNVKEAVTQVFRGLEDVLVNFVETGKLNIKDLVDSIIADFARIAIRKAITEPLANALAGAIGGWAGTGSGAGAGGGAIGGAGGGTPMYGAAAGAVFRSPSLHRYVNQIHDTPQFFTLARGGVFAEAGTEGVFPLGRDSHGRLGVHALGGGGGGDINFVINNNGPPVKVDQARETVDSRGNRSIELTLSEVVAGEMARTGSAMHNATRSTFGLRQQMVPR